MPTFCAVSDGHWRLTIDIETGLCCELSNLDNDPEEDENLVGEQKFSDVQEHLTVTCQEFLAAQGKASK